MSKVDRSARPGLRTGRSESEPIVMATRGCWSEVNEGKGDLVEELEGAGMPFLSARMESATVMRGLMCFSAEVVSSRRSFQICFEKRFTLCHRRSNDCNVANLPSWLRFLAVHM